MDMFRNFSWSLFGSRYFKIMPAIGWLQQGCWIEASWCRHRYYRTYFCYDICLLGQYSAIAFVFAAKSIVRFGETKERKFAEYYLIGTMSSILFALLTGIATAYLRKYFWLNLDRYRANSLKSPKNSAPILNKSVTGSDSLNSYSYWQSIN